MKDVPSERVQKHKSRSPKIISKEAFYDGWSKGSIMGVSLLCPKITLLKNTHEKIQGLFPMLEYATQCHGFAELHISLSPPAP